MYISLPPCTNPNNAGGTLGTMSLLFTYLWYEPILQPSKCLLNFLVPTLGCPKVLSSSTGILSWHNISATKTAIAPPKLCPHTYTFSSFFLPAFTASRMPG